MRNLHPECVRYGLECPYRDVALPAFQFPYVGTVQAANVPKHVLGPAPLKTKFSNPPSNLTLNVLHYPECGSTLDKTIQDMSCI